MNVFGLRSDPGGRSWRDALLGDQYKGGIDPCGLLRLQNARLAERFNPRPVACYIGGEQPVVERERLAESLQAGVEPLSEAAPPQSSLLPAGPIAA